LVTDPLLFAIGFAVAETPPTSAKALDVNDKQPITGRIYL